jgi:hypothetical protein
LRKAKLYYMDATDGAAVISGSLDEMSVGNDSRFLVDGDEKVGLVICAAGFAFGFDLPVSGRGIGERGGELVRREAEFDRDFRADEIGDAVVVESDHVFVEFVADDLGAAVVACAGGDVAFLDAAQGEGKGIDCGEMARGAQAGAQSATEKIRELVVGEEAVAVAEQVTKHLRPAHPEDEADESENAGEDKKGPGAALRVTDPEEWNEKGVPDEGAEETAEHGVEGGEVDAFRAPVKIEEPGLAGSLRGFTFIDCFSDDAADAVGEEEKAGGEEHGADDGDEPNGRVVAGLDDVEGGKAYEATCDQEGQAEESGGDAVDGGGALRGIVCESGRHAGAAAKHALLEGCGVIGGNGERHGWCLLARVPGISARGNRTVRKRYTVLIGCDGWAG